MARPDPTSAARLAAAVGSPQHRPRLDAEEPVPMPAGGAWPAVRRVAPPSAEVVREPATLPFPAVLPAPAATDRRGGFLRSLVPARWRGARMDPGRPGATALTLVAAAAAVVAAIGVWADRPRAEPIAALPSIVVDASAAADPASEAAAAPTAASGAAGADAAPVVLVVSVSGMVQRPGLVEVPDGARVADVLEAAGGALPGTDLSGLNLARRVADGEQVAVGVPPAPDAASGGAVPDAPTGSGGAAVSGPVNLNTATAAQLDALPGVGPVTAQRILEWRERNGRFSRVEQLREIEGIGERRFAQLRELVVV